ncbi:TAT-variant-translocated molybdopterin oxidoreductase [Solitalea koreensis]|uniref:Quinol:cytochrome c oxidoreductase iron-sulfur protein n=1 Tax=Solitalea koreensis TaxID=543615 RepID=A0A521AXI2_9SPHI|nr:TAT-variant-translocated molybdopterin oxidoreductase [Solitalea koreensis]SMO39240.1 quinol:cytochrome c oxidoreductase iron-sulfur protein precursor [Solitalea koreensis]
MDSNNKKYWKGLEELNPTPAFEALQKREFAEDLPIEEILSGKAVESTVMPRRDFLKSLGFSVGAVALAACNTTPVTKAVPYLIKPEEITPGIPNYYTSASKDGYSILVKTREGRPIKIEGNPNCPVAHGGVDAAGQASVIDLYDSTKLQGPLLKGNESSWEEVDEFVKKELAKVSASGKKVVILSSTINSPSTNAVIADFIKAYPTAKQVTYEPVSYSGIINANKNSFDKAVLPSYKFENAEVIVSFGADFLGTWISPVEFTRAYVSNRNAKKLKKTKKMSRHIQFETELSLTGSNADVRIPVKPSQNGLAILGLYNNIAKLAGAQTFSASTPEFAGNIISKTANELWANKGKSLVVAGSNDVSVQILVNAINELLGNYGSTIDLDNVSLQNKGNDAEMIELVNEMNRGEVGAIFIYGVNPSYSYPKAADFSAAMKKVSLKVSFNERADETSKLADVIAPDHHFLEAWNDAEPKLGTFIIAQPTINHIYDTRAAQKGLLVWANNPIEYVDYIKNVWNTTIFPQVGVAALQDSWDNALRAGFVQAAPKTAQQYTHARELTQSVVSTILAGSKVDAGKLELTVYKHTNIGDGRGANNPLLQENPDPVSKVTWDNYIAIAPATAKEMGINEGDVLEVASTTYSTTLPVLIQPGQALGTASIALGYGRTDAGKCGNGVGKNAYPFVSIVNGTMQNYSSVTVKPNGDSYELAQTQTHHSIEGRDIVRETTLAEYAKNPAAGSQSHHEIANVAQRNAKGEEERYKEGNVKLFNIWEDKEKKGHHWGMAIDLNACTGCGSCIVSCSIENNVAVVGRDEVRRRREMHWLRIDRYYAEVEKGTEGYVEGAVEVIHQPMLCQHCDHAPCETVCPVLATMHSSEGLNQMAYNRCFGTRYCANNCPYKVRRFNWFNYADNEDFDYYMNNPMGKLVLNPDVTVRTRGVMEKCSMCVQRIQAGKLKAKMENRQLVDGDIKTACQQSCPANAIVFGDINDPASEVSKLLKNERTFYVLEELNVQPGIGYLTMVRNKEKAAHGHGEHAESHS